MKTPKKTVWSKWWVDDSDAWNQLIKGKQPDAIDEMRWAGWLYELLSRERGAYLFGKSFVDLAPGLAWLWRDTIIDTQRPEKTFAPCCSAREVNALSDLEESEIHGKWSEPVCFNLLRGDSEILDAVKSRLDAMRRDLGVSNPGKESDKAQPWAEVEALENYLLPAGKTVRPKQAFLAAKKRLAKWHTRNPGRLDRAIEVVKSCYP